VITGNKQWGASFLETKASTTFNAGSGIASSLETMTIGIWPREPFKCATQTAVLK
jgi:hypothetical protein